MFRKIQYYDKSQKGFMRFDFETNPHLNFNIHYKNDTSFLICYLVVNILVHFFKILVNELNIFYQ